MEIKQIVTGMIGENCYLVCQNGSALIIDPGAEPEKIKQAIETAAVKPLAILLTHTHYDHIGAVDDIRDVYEIPVYVSPLEQDWLGDPVKNFSADKSSPVTARDAEHLFEMDKFYDIGEFHFKVVHTPGHSPGSVSLLFEEDGVAFTGDALFGGSVGRTDIPGSEPEKLLPGIQKQLFTLPDDTRVYPGHRGDTTIGREKKTNPYFQ